MSVAWIQQPWFHIDPPRRGGVAPAMPTALIIGSGPGAAGAALALAADANQEITVIDVGCTLEEDLRMTRRRIASTEEPLWSASDVERISHQPVPTHRGVLPQKRAFGSDFPFRDVGQLEGVQAIGSANPSVVSGAYGGFSNIWGAQIMPFSKRTFDRWPITSTEMESHYRIALSEMTLAGDEDDLSELFPLMVRGSTFASIGRPFSTLVGSVPGPTGPCPVARDHRRSCSSCLPGR